MTPYTNCQQPGTSGNIFAGCIEFEGILDMNKTDVLKMEIRENYENQAAGRKCTNKQCKRLRCLMGKGFLRHIPDDILRTYSYGKVQRLLEIAEANIHRM